MAVLWCFVIALVCSIVVCVYIVMSDRVEVRNRGKLLMQMAKEDSDEYIKKLYKEIEGKEMED